MLKFILFLIHVFILNQCTSVRFTKWSMLCSVHTCTMQCNAMQCNAMQCNAMQCNAMQCNAMLCNAMQCNAMQCNTIQLYMIVVSKHQFCIVTASTILTSFFLVIFFFFSICKHKQRKFCKIKHISLLLKRFLEYSYMINVDGING